ncbi:MAG: hypothetical protein H3C31_00815 [Brumimicrobium sp.]|nr:hypothetical protein [Brumimicrobium sp.]MCO5268183.1 hypothetical protein [Brumimicrobium sp.]
MKKLYYISLICIICISLSSCFKKKEKEICDENKICYTEGPDDLYVKLKISKSNKPVEIRMYKGYYDKGEKIDKFFTNNTEETYLLPIDNRYTATAKYVVNGDTIMVIDSDELGNGAYKNCDKSCYDWEEGILLDLELKK